MQFLSKINEVPIWQWVAIGWGLGVLTVMALTTIRNEGLRGITDSSFLSIALVIAGATAIILGLPLALSISIAAIGLFLEVRDVWIQRQSARECGPRYSPPIKAKVRATERIHEGKPEPLLLRGRH
jgi:hypothetical protein